MDATFTFTSARPDQVAVDATGKVTSMVPVGSTQIAVMGAGLTSRPLLALVVQPQPGTVLVADAQVVAAPAQVDPTADPVPGAQYKVTLDGVGTLAPGTMLVSSEGNAVAGQVVSTAPNGAHTDVVYQLPALLDLFARVDFQEDYHYDLQTAADDDAIAALAAAAAVPPGIGTKSSALDVSIGPLKCSSTVAPTGITIEQSLKVVQDLTFDAAFTKNDDGDWTTARMEVEGSIDTSGKLTAKLAPGAIASLSCKYQWKEFIPPVAGPLSFLVAPRIPVGVKAELKGAAMLGVLELGGKLEEIAHLTLGFDAGPGGAGDLTSFTLDSPHLEPLYSPNQDLLPLGVEISAALGAYASLNVSILEIGLAEAFVGAKLKYQVMSLENQAGSMTPNQYQLKAPIIEVGPGSGIKKALSLLGGTINFKTTISTEGPVIATSPSGMFTADNKMITVHANDPLTFTVTLDRTTTSFLGISNVSGVHIYRADALVVPQTFNEVKYLSGAGPTFTWTWTPKTTDEGQYTFLAAFDDVVVHAVDAIGVSPPFVVGKNPPLQIDVGTPAGNWGGTITLTWTGMGKTTSGDASTENGSQVVTYMPGMPSIDGVSFDMMATMSTFSVTYGYSGPGGNLGICPATETYNATGMFTHTGADADKEAHGLLTVIPAGDSATYTFGVPGLFTNADFNDDFMSNCGTSQHNTGLVLIGATGTPAMGTIKADATSIIGGTSYMAHDGLFGETMMYTATWDLEKM